MEVCSIYRFDARVEAACIMVATHGLDPARWTTVSMGIDEGLTGFVIEKGEPVMAIDALAHPRYKYFPETGEERYHSFLGVPIVDRREALGVLVVQTSRRRRFTRDEVRLMKAVAVPVGGLLVQLRLLQSLESKEEERRGYQQRMLDAIKKLQAYERRQAPAGRGGPRSPPCGWSACRRRRASASAAPTCSSPRSASPASRSRKPRSARKELARFHAAVERSVRGGRAAEGARAALVPRDRRARCSTRSD